MITPQDLLLSISLIEPVVHVDLYIMGILSGSPNGVISGRMLGSLPMDNRPVGEEIYFNQHVRIYFGHFRTSQFS
jgi:hypothetical protein